MEAGELRIGNYVESRIFAGKDQKLVHFTGKVFAVGRTSVKLGDGVTFPIDSLHGIPLTKQWVEKLGFKDGKLEVTPFVNLHYYGDGKIVLVVEESYTVLTYIQNVHQLQNLYFSLTGQELRIKK